MPMGIFYARGGILCPWGYFMPVGVFYAIWHKMLIFELVQFILSLENVTVGLYC